MTTNHCREDREMQFGGLAQDSERTRDQEDLAAGIYVWIWPIASFRCTAEFGRYRGIADIE